VYVLCNKAHGYSEAQHTEQGKDVPPCQTKVMIVATDLGH